MNLSAHILGSGGIGVAAGICLVRAGWNVTMVDCNPAKVAAGRAEGMCIEGQPAVRTNFVHFDQWTQPVDTTIFLCVKTFDNENVLKRMTETSTLVPIQNGYHAQLEQLNHPAEAIASFVSECAADRPTTRITRAGSLHIGMRRNSNAREQEATATLIKAFAQGNLFSVQGVPNIRPFKNTKLMYNAAISPLAASAGVDNAQLLIHPLARRLFFALLRENYNIFRSAHQQLDTIGPFHPDTVMRILSTPLLPNLMGLFFRPSLRGTYCSMSPDMGSGRTEIDAYNGHLIRIASDFPCPINRAVVAMVERISTQKLSPTYSHLEQMATALPQGTLK